MLRAGIDRYNDNDMTVGLVKNGIGEDMNRGFRQIEMLTIQSTGIIRSRSQLHFGREQNKENQFSPVAAMSKPQSNPPGGRLSHAVLRSHRTARATVPASTGRSASAPPAGRATSAKSRPRARGFPPEPTAPRAASRALSAHARSAARPRPRCSTRRASAARADTWTRAECATARQRAWTRSGAAARQCATRRASAAQGKGFMVMSERSAGYGACYGEGYGLSWMTSEFCKVENGVVGSGLEPCIKEVQIGG